MGIYLSTPKTEKISEDGENDRVRFGLSSMQGWRATMEDAVSTYSKLSISFIHLWSHFVMVFILAAVLGQECASISDFPLTNA